MFVFPGYYMIANAMLNRLVGPYLTSPMGRPSKSGIQIRLVDRRYRKQTWDKERSMMAKIEWIEGELFPKIGFVVTDSKLPAGKVVKVSTARCDMEKRIQEGGNTLRWDKTSCLQFAANQARLLMGSPGLQASAQLRQFYSPTHGTSPRTTACPLFWAQQAAPLQCGIGS